LGGINTLPQALRDCSAYAVYDQKHTLNTDRFRPMLDGENNIIECNMNDLIFNQLLDLGQKNFHEKFWRIPSLISDTSLIISILFPEAF
jgi:hypothetical protein